MTWVLIIILSYQTPPMTFQFNSLRACAEAKIQVERDIPKVQAYCLGVGLG